MCKFKNVKIIRVLRLYQYLEVYTTRTSELGFTIGHQMEPLIESRACQAPGKDCIYERM